MSEKLTSTQGRHAVPVVAPRSRPYRRPAGSVVVRLVLGLAVVTAAVGAVVLWRPWLVGLTAADAWDARVRAWWADERNASWASVAHGGTWLSGAVVTAVVTLLAMVVLRVWLGRWYESGVLLVAVGGAALCFVVVGEVVVGSHLVTPHLDPSHLVLPRLDPARPASGHPSGHVGIVVALYGCLAVVVRRSARSRLVRVVVPVLLWLVPAALALSRVAHGADVATEVVLGALVGLVWLAVVLDALLPRIVRLPEPTDVDGAAAPATVEVSARP